MKQSEIDEIKNHCKYNPIGFYTPMSVLRVINHFEQLLTKTNHSVAKERDEKRLLQEEINQLIDGNKVSLPRELAEAVEGLKAAGLNEFGIFNSIFKPHTDRRLQLLDTYITADTPRNFNKLITALVNGYTIEETPQERIKRGVQEIYEKWTTIQSSGDDQADGADLAERISNFVSNELKL